MGTKHSHLNLKIYELKMMMDAKTLFHPFHLHSAEHATFGSMNLLTPQSSSTDPVSTLSCWSPSISPTPPGQIGTYSPNPRTMISTHPLMSTLI